MKIVIIIIAAMFTGLALADDIKTMDGKEYKGVTVSRTEPDGIVVVTDSGIEKIPFTSLPKETQLKYGFDAQKAAAYAAQVAAAQRALFEKNQKELQKAHDQDVAIADAPEKEKREAEAKAEAAKRTAQANQSKAVERTFSGERDGVYYPDAHNGSGN